MIHITLKARYIVLGFQENSELQSESQTGTICLILTQITSEQWTLKLINIKAALLQGRELDQNMF